MSAFVFPVSPPQRRGSVAGLEDPSSQKEVSMSHALSRLPSSKSRLRAGEAKLCQRITFVTACLLLPIVLARRAIGWVTHGAPRRFESVFAEARADAGAIVPYIFMG